MAYVDEGEKDLKKIDEIDFGKTETRTERCGFLPLEESTVSGTKQTSYRQVGPLAAWKKQIENEKREAREREREKKFPKIKPQTKGSNRRLLEESRSNDFYSIDEIRK